MFAATVASPLNVTLPWVDAMLALTSAASAAASLTVTRIEPGTSTTPVKSTLSAVTVNPVNSVVPANVASPLDTTVRFFSPRNAVSIDTAARSPPVVTIVTSSAMSTAATSPAAAPSRSTVFTDSMFPYSVAVEAACSVNWSTFTAPNWMAPSAVAPAASNVSPYGPVIRESAPNRMSPPGSVAPNAVSISTAAVVNVTKSVSTKSTSPPSLWIPAAICASFARTIRPPVPTATVPSKSAVSASTVNVRKTVAPTACANVAVPAEALTVRSSSPPTPATVPNSVTSPS